MYRMKPLSCRFWILLGAHFLCTSILYAQQKTVVHLERAGSMKNLKIGDRNIIRYIGDVRFNYDNSRLVCDSAYLDPADNSFDAFGNVVITKEDSRITGDMLHFDGSTSLGKLTGQQVKMVDKDATLTTDILFFNSKTSYAYYLTGGEIISKDSRLVSRRGYYNKSLRTASFAENVEMYSPDGTIYTDSLEYMSEIEKANFHGATYIYNEDNFAYCEQGWYNRTLKQSSLESHAYVLAGTRRLFGDAIFYDQVAGYARAVGNVVAVDTVNRVYAYGDRANYWDDRKEAEITENPYVMMIEKGDTLFLRAEKMYLQTIKDSSCGMPDSTYRIVKALGDVRFYRSDFQGVCDSMVSNSLDSSLVMHVDPVIWNGVNQMSANLITAYSDGKSVRQMDFVGSAFIASMEDSAHFNQIRGKSIFAYFLEGKMRTMDVLGNGQSVYYAKENDTITMVNRVDCTNITIHFSNNKVNRIVFKDKPNSNFYPVDKIDIEEVTLKGFKWRDSVRPKDKYSIIPTTLVLFPEQRGEAHRLLHQPKAKVEPVGDVDVLTRE